MSRSVLVLSVILFSTYLGTNILLIEFGRQWMSRDVGTKVRLEFLDIVPGGSGQNDMIPVGNIFVENKGVFPQSIYLPPMFACGSYNSYIPVKIKDETMEYLQPIAIRIKPNQSKNLTIFITTQQAGWIEIRDDLNNLEESKRCSKENRVLGKVLIQRNL